MVAKRRTVVTFRPVSLFKSVNSHRDRGGRGRETLTVVTFGLASGERKGKERGEKRDERRAERREERREEESG